MWIVLPEIIVLIMACIILIISVVLPEKSGKNLGYGLTVSTLLLAALAVLIGREESYAIGLFGLVIQDPISDISKLTICLITVVVLVYGRSYAEKRGLLRGEFLTLILFGTVGMMVMVSASHLITVYIGLELMSLCLYALIALHRDSVEATEAAMKYFILGALASGILLYGMSLLYGLTGGLELAQIQQSVVGMSSDDLPLVIALILVIVGLLFKLGAVPFHMWVPDVYEGSPTVVTAYLASATKIAVFVILFRLLAISLESLLNAWQDMLIAVALLSIGFGNLAAIAQKNIKRMLAYSTIAHMGFFLLGMLSGDIIGYSAAMIYVLVYAVVSVGVFGCILHLTREGFEADKLEDYRGLSETEPWLAFLLLLFMFSLAGVPPTVGFYAKLSIFQAVVGAGLIWVAIPAVLFTVIGAFYYLRIVKLMYFDEPSSGEVDQQFVPALDSRALLMANGLLMVAIMPWIGSIAEVCRDAISLVSG
jgi:NADH-quinone oxidoreductase subunit N